MSTLASITENLRKVEDLMRAGGISVSCGDVGLFGQSAFQDVRHCKCVVKVWNSRSSPPLFLRVECNRNPGDGHSQPKHMKSPWGFPSFSIPTLTLTLPSARKTNSANFLLPILLPSISSHHRGLCSAF